MGNIVPCTGCFSETSVPIPTANEVWQVTEVTVNENLKKDLSGQVFAGSNSTVVKSLRTAKNTIDQEEVRVFYEHAVKSSASKDGGSWDGTLRLEHLQFMAEKLKFTDLDAEALERILQSMERNTAGKVSLDQFMQSLERGQSRAILRTFVGKLRAGCAFGFEIPKGYDIDKTTNENYAVSSTSAESFFGDFAEIRRERDYSYHVNYSEERQAWQDEAVKSVIVRSDKLASPWLVYTCGPMGVGKGYSLSWMSKKGFFPLENIVHVDPDGFKMMMPEWPHYVAGDSETAGTMCHQESCFMMEVAQEAAMQKRQNVWVDGSLRNAEFYRNQFLELRERYPFYRIAIFYVSASESTIRARIKHRAEATGRDVPEKLIMASLNAMDHALNTLTPHTDFVVRINNDGQIPVLLAFETVDVTGHWETVQKQFADMPDNVIEFPHALSPLVLAAQLEEHIRFFRHGNFPKALRLELGLTANAGGNGLSVTEASQKMYDKLKATLATTIEFSTSPPCDVTLPAATRHSCGIPLDATSFVWVYPFMRSKMLRSAGFSEEEIGGRFMQLFQRGGFCYFGAKGEVLKVNTVLSHIDDGEGYLQFGKRTDLSNDVASAIPESRFQPAPSRYREAVTFSWMLPGETFAAVNVGGLHGAFIFQLEEPGGHPPFIRFPVMAT